MVSGTLSLFCSGCFSPFPHGTGSTIGLGEYLALPDGPGRFTQNSSCSALLRIPLCFVLLRIPDCHRLWQSFQNILPWQEFFQRRGSKPHPCRNMWFGLSPFACHYWGIIVIFFSCRYLDVSSSPLSSFRWGWYPFRISGLSHLEIQWIKGYLHLPWLIAAYHVLHRLREPRHPPCALSYFLLSMCTRILRCVDDIYF